MRPFQKTAKLTVSVCSQNNSEFDTFGQWTMDIGLVLEFVVQRLNSKSGTSFSKNKPLKLNFEPPKPQNLFLPKLHPKVRCTELFWLHIKNPQLLGSRHLLFLKTYLLQDTKRFSSFNRKFPWRNCSVKTLVVSSTLIKMRRVTNTILL